MKCFPVLSIRTYSKFIYTKFIYTILLYLFLCSVWSLCAVISYLDKTDVVSIHQCWSFFLLTQVKGTCKLILQVEPHSSYTQPFYTANHCFLDDTKKKEIWTDRYLCCFCFRNRLLYIIILLIKPPMSPHNYAISYCPCDHHVSYIVCCVRYFLCDLNHAPSASRRCSHSEKRSDRGSKRRCWLVH